MIKGTSERGGTASRSEKDAPQDYAAHAFGKEEEERVNKKKESQEESGSGGLGSRSGREQRPAS